MLELKFVMRELMVGRGRSQRSKVDHILQIIKKMGDPEWLKTKKISNDKGNTRSEEVRRI